MSWRVIFLATAMAGCNLGTIADLSQNDTDVGNDEETTQALKLWKAFDQPDDAMVKATASFADVVAHAGALPVKAKIGPLTKDDRGMPADARDPSAAQGFLIVTQMGCSFDQVEKLEIATNQPELFPDTYDNYKRTYEGNVQDFLSGSAPKVVWHTNYGLTVISRKYQADLTGTARVVPGAAPGGKPLLVVRTVLDHPANFTAGGDDSGFEQDYQIEGLYESGPNVVTHFWAIWRQFHIGSLSVADDAYLNIVLGRSVDGDTRLGIVCKKQAPTPKFD